MIFKKHNHKGVATIGEYLLTFALVVAVVAGMATYFQRAIQGRMRDARHYVATNLREQCNDTDCVGRGSIGEGYEPYYAQINSEVVRNEVSYKGVTRSGTGISGLFFARGNAENTSDTQSNQLPPARALNDKVLGGQ